MAKEDKLGALWRSKSTNEKAPFAKGSIEFMGRKLDIVVWINSYKKEDKHPDFVIELDKPRNGQTQEPRSQQAPRQTPQAPSQGQLDTSNPRRPDDFTDDIPFN